MLSIEIENIGTLKTDIHQMLLSQVYQNVTRKVLKILSCWWDQRLKEIMQKQTIDPAQRLVIKLEYLAAGDSNNPNPSMS